MVLQCLPGQGCSSPKRNVSQCKESQWCFSVYLGKATVAPREMSASAKRASGASVFTWARLQCPKRNVSQWQREPVVLQCLPGQGCSSPKRNVSQCKESQWCFSVYLGKATVAPREMSASAKRASGASVFTWARLQ